MHDMKKTTEVRRWILGYGFEDSGRALKDTEFGFARQGVFQGSFRAFNK